MYGLAGCRDWLREEVRRVVGVAAADGLFHFAGLERTADGWQVACLESVLFEPAEARAVSLAEKTAALLARLGWEEAPIVLALPQEEVCVEAMQLPALPAQELAQTAHWEMAAREPFGGAPLRTACAHLGDGACRVAAVSAEAAEELRRAFAAADVRLWALAAPPEEFRLLYEADGVRFGETVLPIAPALLEADGAYHGWDERLSCAVYGAALLVRAVPEPGLCFPFGAIRLSGPHCRRIAAAAVLLTAALLLIATGVDIYRLHDARQAVQQVQGELALSRGETNRMEDFRAEEAWIARRDERLRALSAENPPAAAVLSLLGTRNVAGVRLTELTLQTQGRLELKGEAVAYDALADYLGGFEAQEGALSGAVTLTESARQSDGSIAFSLQVALPEGEAATAGEEKEAPHASME